jgi:hypothetical protein
VQPQKVSCLLSTEPLRWGFPEEQGSRCWTRNGASRANQTYCQKPLLRAVHKAPLRTGAAGARARSGPGRLPAGRLGASREARSLCLTASLPAPGASPRLAAHRLTAHSSRAAKCQVPSAKPSAKCQERALSVVDGNGNRRRLMALVAGGVVVLPRRPLAPSP